MSTMFRVFFAVAIVAVFMPRFADAASAAVVLDADRYFRQAERAFFDENYDEALRWYKEAAEAGHQEARTSIGFMYFSGKGVPRDPDEAGKWYQSALAGLRRSAAEGNIQALRTLGFMYQNGLGVSASASTAVAHYTQAAEHGDTGSMRSLGMLHETGLAGTVNTTEAMNWLTRAAEAGDTTAMRMLASRYEAGVEGVSADGTRAIHWYQTAADFGDTLAAAALKRLGVAERPVFSLYPPSGDKVYKMVQVEGAWVDMDCFHSVERCLALGSVNRFRALPNHERREIAHTPGYSVCSRLNACWIVLRDALHKEHDLCLFSDETVLDTRSLREPVDAQ